MENWTSKNNKPQRSKSKLLIGVIFGLVLSAILYYMTSVWSINQEPMKERYRRYKGA
ncbi:hypothetical protein HX049_00060 [Myroides odoratimimus]|uniref:hypothetical protein n=1 Tax=Myroides odoratimimus TaxID=76832 RepID=UPI0025749D89|nr:hypothetical protein [Myroides odoratimimus]MDM1395584.1 hypothetical protein [Myroides odoratimimus]